MPHIDLAAAAPVGAVVPEPAAEGRVPVAAGFADALAEAQTATGPDGPEASDPDPDTAGEKPQMPRDARGDVRLTAWLTLMRLAPSLPNVEAATAVTAAADRLAARGASTDAAAPSVPDPPLAEAFFQVSLQVPIAAAPLVAPGVVTLPMPALHETSSATVDISDDVMPEGTGGIQPMRADLPDSSAGSTTAGTPLAVDAAGHMPPEASPPSAESHAVLGRPPAEGTDSGPPPATAAALASSAGVMAPVALDVVAPLSGTRISRREILKTEQADSPAPGIASDQAAGRLPRLVQGTGSGGSDRREEDGRVRVEDGRVPVIRSGDDGRSGAVGLPSAVARTLAARFKANELPETAVASRPRGVIDVGEPGRPLGRGSRESPAAIPLTVAATPSAGLTPATRWSAVNPTSSQGAVDERGQDLQSQVVQAIKVQWSASGGDARIRLQPNYLGELTISLKVENGSVIAHLAASVPEVRQWIETNEATLRQGLAQQDLKLERLVVVEEESAHAASDEPETAGRDERQPPRPRRRRPQSDATFEVVV